MTHIDDWLDDPTTGPADVKEWLEHFRRPAIDKDHAWLRARKLLCTYKDGKRYRCIGCSRMGDVWLTKHFERENGYDLRIDIADCTDWEVTPNAPHEGPGAASSRTVPLDAVVGRHNWRTTMTYKILIDHRACGGGGCEECKEKGTARVRPFAPPDLSISAADFEEARQTCPCYEGIKVNAEVSQCSHPEARQFDSWCSVHDCPALTPNA